MDWPTVVILAAFWWVIGALSMLWLSRGENITWFDLTVCWIVGLLGPGLWVVIGLTIFVQADFWSKPVFRRKHD